MSAPAESSPTCPVKECAKEPAAPLLCASSYEYLSPLLLAEELCPQAIAAAIKAEQNRPEDKNDRHPEASHNFRLGSLFLDLSNAWGVRDNSSEKFSARAFELLGAAAESETYSRAKTLSSFLCIYENAFQYRWVDKAPGKVLDEVSEGLVGMVKSFEQLSSMGAANDEYFRGSMMLLYIVYDYLAFPATARESLDLRGMINSEAYQPVAHPLYTIEYGSKMPHRSKPRRLGQADPQRVVSIRFNQLAKEAFDYVERPLALNEQEAGKLALHWLCEKAGGATLSQNQEACLLEMTSRLGRKRNAWYRNWKKPSSYRPH